MLSVDWSGAADPAGQRRAIWVAEAVDGALVTLTAGRTRAETVTWILERADRGEPPLVGFDFSFSFPAWWGRELGASCGPDLWPVVAERGEEWLRGCQPPFWGRTGKSRPPPTAAQDPFRRTEHELRALGLRPTSTFQIGGAGSVGTGSIRGMPHLSQLRAAGVAVWPFDKWSTTGPVAAEIYPRWYTGPVVKSRERERRHHLGELRPPLPPALLDTAASGDDAFDAALAALVLSAGVAPLAPLDDIDRLEGRVLAPPASGRGGGQTPAATASGG